ncbi:MAG: helix-turn-helix transcriptional regulator [Hyphomonadaceae bacterium]
MDDSKDRRANAHDYEGAVVEHQRCSGAHVSRIMHPPRQRISTHEHDWPVLTLYRLGSYRELADNGRTMVFDGPSVVFQPAGAAHADEIGERGLETLAMTFDPAWLSDAARERLPSQTLWRPGGAIALAARRLADVWLDVEASDERLSAATSQFLTRLFATGEARAPSWVGRVSIEANTEDLARSLGLNAAWLARAYRAWRGEGLAETARRHRVERAALLLRKGCDALADVAAASGFCDQSHMNRAFRAVLGRTPLEVRREAALLTTLAA